MTVCLYTVVCLFGWLYESLFVLFCYCFVGFFAC